MGVSADKTAFSFAKALVVAMLLSGAVIVGVTVAYVSAYNEGNKSEEQIKYLNTESENRLSSYTNSVLEQAQIPEKYKDNLKDVLKTALEARYGDTGNKSTISFIQEHAVNFDSKMYENIQATIKSGREEFRISQTRKIETCRNYRTSLGYFWKGTFLKFAGYPKVNLDDVCALVSDERSMEAFKTKKTSPIKL
ncbi:virion structural protein [Pectobacterium phage vB_ParM-25]|nr:hypothetical protein [Serratia phage BUCT660]UQT03782.1 hypothetical protein KODAMA_03150 [Serratia phage vB_SmaM-Kodama]URG14170.1 virion structural protein [Pectobacterium phage vB_ParM-25]